MIRHGILRPSKLVADGKLCLIQLFIGGILLLSRATQLAEYPSRRFDPTASLTCIRAPLLATGVFTPCLTHRRHRPKEKVLLNSGSANRKQPLPENRER